MKSHIKQIFKTNKQITGYASYIINMNYGDISKVLNISMGMFVSCLIFPIIAQWSSSVHFIAMI